MDHYTSLISIPYPAPKAATCYILGTSASMLDSVHSAHVDCFQTHSRGFHDYTVCKNILCASPSPLLRVIFKRDQFSSIFSR
jgi:hypothetical protein